MPGADDFPAVYIEESSFLPPAVVAADTSIPVFIGYTETDTQSAAHDLHLKAARIASLREFERLFGVPQRETNIAITINETRDAHGKLLTTKAVASFNPVGNSLTPVRSKYLLSYALQLYFANGGGPCYVVSVGLYEAFPGAVQLRALMAGLDAASTFDGPTLILFPEAQALSIEDFATLHNAALRQCSERQDRFLIMDVHGDNASPGNSQANLHDILVNFRARGIGADNIKFGAAYAPNIETTVAFALDESTTAVRTIVNGAPQLSAPPILSELAATDRATYDLATAAARDLPNILPPSGAIAGAYVITDNARGVWKAPANIALNFATKPAIQYGATLQEDMNVSVTGKSVNAMQQFAGQGTLVWGARTLDGNSLDWRYVNVRRFVTFVETTVRRALQPFVFEPNDANTWSRLQAMVETFLATVWRQGALAGIKPEDAFFVRIGLGITMTQQDILDGRLLMTVGLSVLRPAEFIVLTVSYKMVPA